MIKRLYLIFYSFSKQLQRDNIGAYASSISFFFLLSMIPLLLIACMILGRSPINQDEVLLMMRTYSPDFLDGYIDDFIPQIYETSATVLPIAIVTLLWSAGKGMWGLMMGLNTANDVKESRNVLWVRIQASFYSILMMITLVACMGMVLAGENVLGRIERIFPNITSALQILGYMRFVVVWGFLTILFTLLYTIVPNRKLKLRYQVPGAVFSAIGWSVTSFGFSVYMNYFSETANFYGSLSTIIICMIWLYCIMYIFLIGANLNRYFGSIIKMVLGPKDSSQQNV